MNAPLPANQDLVDRISTRLLDVLIRAGLILAMAALCYRVMSPFVTLMVWAIILAVALYPAHQFLARKLRGKQGLAATLLVLFGALIIVFPTALLLSSLGDSVRGLVHDIQANTLEIRAPGEGVKDWPVVGERLYAAWALGHNDLPALVTSLQPKIGEVARWAVGAVASIGGGLILFLFSFVIAGIVMAYGEGGARASRSIFARVAGQRRGDMLAALSTSTIRAVAQGVIGVAFIQAIVVGLALLAAGVPWAGVLALVTLVLGIAQVPVVLISIPAIFWIWSSGAHGGGMATVYTVVLLIAGLSDNVLKPLMLGRGVEAPMPVILFGALGGMATAGIPGMFVGATLLAVGYRMFMEWVASGVETPVAATAEPTRPPEVEPTVAPVPG
jgi:predicted PurR-regulated permease PerM